MNNIYILIFVLSLITFIGCNSSNNGKDNSKNVTEFRTKSDLEKQNLKGDVILIDVFDDYDDVHDIEQYNEKGNLIRVVTYNVNFGFCSVKNFSYINDKPQSIICEGNQINTKTIFLYNQDGILTSKEMTGKILNSQFHVIDFYNYDINGNLIFDSIIQNNILRSVTKYYYTNNKLNSSKEFNRNGEYNELTYDINGNPSKYGLGNRYEYNYDAKGNWVQKKEISDSKNIYINKRKIFYKGQDVSEYEKKCNDFLATFNSGNSNSGSTDIIVSGSRSNNNSNSSTNQKQNNPPEKRKCDYCKGTGKCQTCSKIFTTHYWAGKYSGWKNGNETRPGQIMCEDCHGSGLIYGIYGFGDDNPASKKCYVSNCRNGWLYCPKCNHYGNGDKLGQCRECRGTGYSNY